LQTHRCTKTNRSYKICIAAFYNLENFYDTTNNPIVNDEDFTNSGVKKYNSKIYKDKIGRLSKVISEIGTDKTADGAAILGVAEIENDTVLRDLIHHPLLQKGDMNLYTMIPKTQGVLMWHSFTIRSILKLKKVIPSP